MSGLLEPGCSWRVRASPTLSKHSAQAARASQGHRCSSESSGTKRDPWVGEPQEDGQSLQERQGVGTRAAPQHQDGPGLGTSRPCGGPGSGHLRYWGGVRNAGRVEARIGLSVGGPWWGMDLCSGRRPILNSGLGSSSVALPTKDVAIQRETAVVICLDGQGLPTVLERRRGKRDAGQEGCCPTPLYYSSI